MPDSECEKALILLIHDLRAPLGVAQGYLRLVKDNRLSPGAERDRALEQVTAALGRMSRLCADASAFAEAPVSERLPATALGVRRFVDQVAHACNTASIDPLVFDVDENGWRGKIRAVHIDLVAEAAAVVLSAVRRAAGSAPVRVAVSEHGDELWFLLGQADDRARLSRSDDPFDAWRGGHGIALPLACRRITASGGRIWSAPDTRGAVAIAFPQETP